VATAAAKVLGEVLHEALKRARPEALSRIV
jgi:hypothetical protein